MNKNDLMLLIAPHETLEYAAHITRRALLDATNAVARFGRSCDHAAAAMAEAGPKLAEAWDRAGLPRESD